MKPILRKLRRLVVLVVVQLLLWLMGCGDAAEPVQPPNPVSVSRGSSIG